VWFVDPGNAGLSWSSYDARRRAQYIKDVEALRVLAVDRPTDLVVFVPAGPGPPGHPCSHSIPRGASFALLPAENVAAAIDGDVIRRCAR
jgi:hypothetical protein